MKIVPEIKLTKDNAVSQIRKFSTKDGLRYAQCNISPEVAKELLTLEKRNRDRHQGTVKVYARYITTGKWELNPDPITFDYDSNLIDGGIVLAPSLKLRNRLRLSFAAVPSLRLRKSWTK